jgi:hypothetical protein
MDRAGDWRGDITAAAWFAGGLALGGVLGLWNAHALLMAFWFDIALSGARHLVMLLASRRHSKQIGIGVAEALFFLVHYGGFSAGFLLITCLAIALETGASPDMPYVFFPGRDAALASPLLFALMAGWHGLLLRRFFMRDGVESLRPRQFFQSAYLRMIGMLGGMLWVASLMSGADDGAKLGALILFWFVFQALATAWPARAEWAPWRLAEKQKREETREIFDIRRHGVPRGTTLFMGVGILFSLIGLAVAIVNPWGWLWLGLAVLWTWLSWTSISSEYKDVRDALVEGRCLIAEGAVEKFRSEDRGKKGLYDFFSVGGVEFGFSANMAKQGYNQIVEFRRRAQ